MAAPPSAPKITSTVKTPDLSTAGSLISAAFDRFKDIGEQDIRETKAFNDALIKSRIAQAQTEDQLGTLQQNITPESLYDTLGENAYTPGQLPGLFKTQRTDIRTEGEYQRKEKDRLDAISSYNSILNLLETGKKLGPNKAANQRALDRVLEKHDLMRGNLFIDEQGRFQARDPEAIYDGVMLDFINFGGQEGREFKDTYQETVDKYKAEAKEKGYSPIVKQAGLDAIKAEYGRLPLSDTQEKELQASVSTIDSRLKDTEARLEARKQDLLAEVGDIQNETERQDLVQKVNNYLYQNFKKGHLNNPFTPGRQEAGSEAVQIANDWMLNGLTDKDGNPVFDNNGNRIIPSPEALLITIGSAEDRSTSLLEGWIDNSAITIQKWSDQIANYMKKNPTSSKADRKNAIRIAIDEEINLARAQALADKKKVKSDFLSTNRIADPTQNDLLYSPEVRAGLEANLRDPNRTGPPLPDGFERLPNVGLPAAPPGTGQQSPSLNIGGINVPNLPGFSYPPQVPDADVLTRATSFPTEGGFNPSAIVSDIPGTVSGAFDSYLRGAQNVQDNYLRSAQNAQNYVVDAFKRSFGLPTPDRTNREVAATSESPSLVETPSLPPSTIDYFQETPANRLKLASVSNPEQQAADQKTEAKNKSALEKLNRIADEVLDSPGSATGHHDRVADEMVELGKEAKKQVERKLKAYTQVANTRNVSDQQKQSIINRLKRNDDEFANALVAKYWADLFAAAKDSIEITVLKQARRSRNSGLTPEVREILMRIWKRHNNSASSEDKITGSITDALGFTDGGNR